VEIAATAQRIKKFRQGCLWNRRDEDGDSAYYGLMPNMRLRGLALTGVEKN